MNIEELIVVMIPLVFILMALIELIFPARQFPKVSKWHLIGVAAFIYGGMMNALLPELLPAAWLAQHRLIDLSGFNLLLQVFIAHLVITFFTFAWHWATHTYPILWRAFHQLHHAPRHINIYVANILHPTDLGVYVLAPTLIALFVLGLEPLAASIVGFIGAFNAFFQHWNVRTPQWLGYFLQRPESHCVHHQRGVHAFNYSDFPLWDILFGSFRNPATWQGETGFDPPADSQYGAMLVCSDVNTTLIGERSMGQRRMLDVESKDAAT